MNEIMTLTEIESKFKSEWILIGDPVTTPDLRVERGTILWHSQNRDDVYRKARELRPKHSAILYTGKIPADMEVVL